MKLYKLNLGTFGAVRKFDAGKCFYISLQDIVCIIDKGSTFTIFLAGDVELFIASVEHKVCLANLLHAIEAYERS